MPDYYEKPMSAVRSGRHGLPYRPCSSQADSAELQVAVVRQECGGRDTSFSVVVSGPTLGGLRLYKRVNGHIVNGNTAKFTEEEMQTLNFASTDNALG